MGWCRLVAEIATLLARAETFTKLFDFVADGSRGRYFISRLRDGEMSSFRRRDVTNSCPTTNLYKFSLGWVMNFIALSSTRHDLRAFQFGFLWGRWWLGSCYTSTNLSAFHIVFSLVPLTRWSSWRFVTRYGRRPTLFQARLWLELSEEIIQHARVSFCVLELGKFNSRGKFHVMQWIRHKRLDDHFLYSPEVRFCCNQILADKK